MDGYSILHTLEVLAFKKERNGIILAFLSVESKIGHEVYTVPTCLLRPWYCNQFNGSESHIQQDSTLLSMMYNFIFALSWINEVERETKIQENRRNIWARVAHQSLLPNLHTKLTLTHACLFFETRLLKAQSDLNLTKQLRMNNLEHLLILSTHF